ncbi:MULTISPECIES: GGDEF domain-containing protein [unclassified Shinella]|uniref:GGDEF domain-containing protein n=1 Tax=unclassified Shinella TaxID=2643062 RepID=UPI00234E564A|nr:MULTISPECIES: GGDEF domain-containing protein [unclassified Shinella]MDC7267293.1 GGDEF domain-containing protein [Shinella sp. HY16]MDC7274175.1 GGDEF domain-containing protein [Shinella sp. YZ44]
MPDERRSAWGGPFGVAFDPLKNWLEALPSPAVWRVVILGMALVFLLDCLLAGRGLRLGPFYLLPICLACWRLSFRAGLSLGVVAAILAAIMEIAITGRSTGTALGNLTMNVSAIGVLGGIVANFRRSVEQERVFARRDGITGALTRQAFEQQAETMIEAAAEQGRPLLLAYLDLDGFKIVNDRYGHEAGDQVLKRFGIAARAALRREDCFGRMGGDEFALLVSLPSIEDAQETAERLHRRFSEALADTAHKVTCSMGAHTIAPDDGAYLDELLRKADRLMYAAKNGGKNGLRFATAAPSLDVELPLFANLGKPSPRPILATRFSDAPEAAGNA